MLLDITGKKYTRLTVLELSHRDKKGRIFWICRCDCGNIKTVHSWHLRRGGTKSCGCLKRDFLINNPPGLTHGESRTGKMKTEYWRWFSIKARCYNPHNRSYPAYGGRGIKICDRWMNDYSAFLSDMGRCPKGYILDRIDVNGNYEPNNCRWISLRDSQANMRPRGIQVCIDGRTQCILEWARELKIPYGTALRRHKAGKPLLRPPKK